MASDRPYTLTIFGATGFTGRLAALYVAKQYSGAGWRWAIAGRSASKLEALKQECGGAPDVVVADSSNAAAVEAMVKQTKVLCACAGPFARYGTPVLAACANHGTDYVDITGETNWVRQMIGQYDDVAKKSGARIVPHCGHDCVPWDLMVLMLNKKLREANAEESLASVDMYDDIKAAASGGTLETAIGILYGPEKKVPRSTLGYDALMKVGDAQGTCRVKAKNVGTLRMGKGSEPHRTYFIMAAVNANTVKRSNAINKYGDQVTYREGQAHSSLVGAICALMSLAFFGMALAVPPMRWALRKFVLPKPGEGPSEADMATGYLTLSATAKGTKGGVARASMHFPTDPGYKDTARMLVESGLTLALGDVPRNSPGGLLTPATCQGEALLKRLESTGTTFAFRSA